VDDRRDPGKVKAAAALAPKDDDERDGRRKPGGDRGSTGGERRDTDSASSAKGVLRKDRLIMRMALFYP
jgi:hypothetical protein